MTSQGKGKKRKTGIFGPEKATESVESEVEEEEIKEVEYLEDDENTLIINENVIITEVMPYVFAKIRDNDRITNTMIKKSLSPEFNREQAFNAGEGQGKSGSFFFFSHDHRFIIKTMNDDEFKKFNWMIEDYLDHMIDNSHSLIARIYGVYTVKKESMHGIHCMLMGNSNKLHDDGDHLKYIFDLKGSLINRHVMMRIKNHKPSRVLKDINLLHIKWNENIIKMVDEDVYSIMQNIEKDVELFRKHNIMDYSLLFAIETNPYYLKYKTTTKRIIR